MNKSSKYGIHFYTQLNQIYTDFSNQIVKNEMNLNHKDLLKLIANNKDKKSFEELFRFYQPKLFLSLKKSGLSEQQALELAQEVMIKVWKSASLYQEEKGEVSTWIFRILRNTKFDFFRKQKNDKLEILSQDIYLENKETSQTDSFYEYFQRMEVRKAIVQLPMEQQKVIHAVYDLGLSHQEFASKENVPIGTVKSRIRLAKESLRVILEER